MLLIQNKALEELLEQYSVDSSMTSKTWALVTSLGPSQCQSLGLLPEYHTGLSHSPSFPSICVRREIKNMLLILLGFLIFVHD